MPYSQKREFLSTMVEESLLEYNKPDDTKVPLYLDESNLVVKAKMAKELAEKSGLHLDSIARVLHLSEEDTKRLMKK